MFYFILFIYFLFHFAKFTVNSASSLKKPKAAREAGVFILLFAKKPVAYESDCIVLH